MLCWRCGCGFLAEELKAEYLNLGSVALVPALVLPFAGMKLTLNIDWRTFLDVVCHNVNSLAVHDERNPLGRFPWLAVASGKSLRHGDTHVRNAPAVLERADFRVGSDVPDKLTKIKC